MTITLWLKITGTLVCLSSLLGLVAFMVSIWKN